jgi:hypothetical protein
MNLFAPVSYAEQTIQTTADTNYRATIWYLWDRGADFQGGSCYLQWSVNGRDTGPRIVLPADAQADTWTLWTVDWVSDSTSARVVWNVYCPNTGSATTAVEVLLDNAIIIQTCAS